MKRFSEIVETVHTLAPATFERSLVGVEWSPLSRRAVLSLLLRQHVARLTLENIHFFGTRKSLLGKDFYRPPSYDAREDWFIHYFDVADDSVFLRAFVEQRIPFGTGMLLYDSVGRKLEARSAVQPTHLAIGCSQGALDIICEDMTLEFDSPARTDMA